EWDRRRCSDRAGCQSQQAVAEGSLPAYRRGVDHYRPPDRRTVRGGRPPDRPLPGREDRGGADGRQGLGGGRCKDGEAPAHRRGRTATLSGGGDIGRRERGPPPRWGSNSERLRGEEGRQDV